MTRAEEAAKAYEESLDYYHCMNDWPSIAYRAGYEQAEKDLGWISVKDRLPEEGHFVLTCVSDTGTPQCVGMALLLNDGTWWDGDIKVRVDYWMEVPRFTRTDSKD